MRIAFVTPEFVTERYVSGGLANYIYRVATALVERGHDVHVVMLSLGDEERLEFVLDGIRVHPIAYFGRIRSLLTRLSAGRLAETAYWLDFAAHVRAVLLRLHREKPFDIVQVPNSRACGLFAQAAVRAPFVTRISCYRPAWNAAGGFRRSFDARVLEWLEWVQLRRSRHIYAPSAALQQMLRDAAGIRNVDLIRTPFFVETGDLDPSVRDQALGSRPYAVFFGRLQMHKGFHVLAEALPAFLAACPDASFVAVGPNGGGPGGVSMRDYARRLCRDADPGRLIFLDTLRHPQLYPVVAGARLAVLPSLVDNLPNVCLESMAWGVPVIGTTGTSFDEVIRDGETGFLVPPGDAPALAERMTAAWRDPRLPEIGRAARAKMAEFAPAVTVVALENYYEAVRRSA